MLREFDLQRMNWADKTQSMLHQRQMEACEARLLSYPTESIFTLQDERETECWWQCAYDAEESPKSPVLHTLREMRANVLARLPVEAALLTETEHALIVRLILCGGQARIDGWQELSAAESLLRRLWCTLEVDEQDVLLHLPRELMTPLSLILREQRHQELRSRLLFFDTDTKAALYLSGMLSAKQALSRLYESVLHDSSANDEALALRYLKAGNDFYYDRAGELFLLHPGLADPEKILREGGFPMGYQPDLPSERALMASRDLLPEEFETDAQLSALLDSTFSGISIKFGGEDSADTFAISNSSFVSGTYYKDGKPAGNLGVIGPMRLDYRRVIPYIEYFSNKITRLLSEETDKPPQIESEVKENGE